MTVETRAKIGVLCGTDFSPLAAKAATVAGLWSRRLGGEVHLLHAGVPTRQGWDTTWERNQLAMEASRLQDLGVSVAGADVVIGHPDEVLAEAAARLAADLVVLGATGHRLADRWLLGSVAARTARESPVPVLVVRGLEPFVAWLEGKRALRVVAGYERGESAAHALRWAADLPRLGAVDLTVVQLVLPGTENRRLNVSGPGIGVELSPESKGQLLEELRLAVAPLVGDVPARLTVAPALGRTDIHLVLEAQQAEADLVVVGSHQRKGFQRWWQGSVSSGVLHAAPMSVAVVPCR